MFYFAKRVYASFVGLNRNKLKSTNLLQEVSDKLERITWESQVGPFILQGLSMDAQPKSRGTTNVASIIPLLFVPHNRSAFYDNNY